MSQEETSRYYFTKDQIRDGVDVYLGHVDFELYLQWKTYEQIFSHYFHFYLWEFYYLLFFLKIIFILFLKRISFLKEILSCILLNLMEEFYCRVESLESLVENNFFN